LLLPKARIEKYVESQCNCKVIHSKPEQTYNELGFEVTIWNVKTDTDGSWWVAADGGLPMNLYPQDKAYYFSTDEVFSFHLGIMLRILSEKSSEPGNILEDIIRGAKISTEIRRKLELTAEKLIEKLIDNHAAKAAPSEG